MQFKAHTTEGPHGELRVALTVEDNGEEVAITTTLCGFANLLKEGIIPVVKNIPCHIGRIPKGYVDAFFLDEENFIVYIEALAEKRNFYYRGEKKYVIPFPRLLFRFEVEKGQLKSKNVVALKKDADIFAPDCNLYNYPFGNVSACSSICMGNIDTKDRTTFYSAGHYVELFFNSITNDDYMHQAYRKFYPQVSQQQLLEMLVEKDEFPEEWLVPSERTVCAIFRK